MTTKALPTFEQVNNFTKLWGFGRGRPILREETFTKWDISWNNSLRRDYDIREIKVAWFSEDEGIGVGYCGDGPPYSEVTPDPQWEASLFYFIVRKAT